MRNRIGILCVALGGVCLLAALGLSFRNYEEELRVERMTQEVLPELQTAIEEQAIEAPETNGAEIAPVTIGGAEYMGYLAIPALGLEFPVQSSWSYPQLKISPCRYAGSVSGGDLIIAAHNYKQHFARLHTLQAGDEIRLTDAAGRMFVYTVVQVGVLGNATVEEMTSGTWDMTLFTCTYGGKSRVAVRCIAEQTAV